MGVRRCNCHCFMVCSPRSRQERAAQAWTGQAMSSSQAQLPRANRTTTSSPRTLGPPPRVAHMAETLGTFPAHTKSNEGAAELSPRLSVALRPILSCSRAEHRRWGALQFGAAVLADSLSLCLAGSGWLQAACWESGDFAFPPGPALLGVSNPRCQHLSAICIN
jgi:hypothetical protein